MKKSMFAMMMAMVMSIGCLSACSQTTGETGGTELASGGVLVLSVNPEIAVEYDENALVTAVTARNDDAIEIIDVCSGLIGKEARQVVTELVSAIGEAGYFVEEIEGERRQITLEIESGSKLPHDDFLDEVVSDIRDCVNRNDWDVPMGVENDSDYGLTDYSDSDYALGNDAVTDYSDSDYGENNEAVTDYDDTDYGVSDDNDSVYGESNYSENSNNNDSDYDVSDYAESDYSDSNYDDTDYDDSDYGESNYDGNSNYDDSDYGDSDYNN